MPRDKILLDKEWLNMVLIVCLDDNNGMMFNNRRQSKDCELRKRMLHVVAGGKLWMSEYSKGQFEEEYNSCDCIESAEYVFVENDKDIPKVEFEKIIVYRWNRKYPGDMFFDLTGRQLVEYTEFQGNSHDKITEEIYQ